MAGEPVELGMVVGEHCNSLRKRGDRRNMPPLVDPGRALGNQRPEGFHCIRKIRMVGKEHQLLGKEQSIALELEPDRKLELEPDRPPELGLDR